VLSDRIYVSGNSSQFGAIPAGLAVPSTDKAGEESRQTFEAVLGALYLSTHTLELVPWLDPLQKQLVQIRTDPARLNYKAVLQEWTKPTSKFARVSGSGNQSCSGAFYC